MTEKKKREKVVAEISLTHLTEFAQGLGLRMTRDEALAFLNQNGHAYDMWKHMMQAGEEYIKSALEQHQRARLFALPRNTPHRTRLAI